MDRLAEPDNVQLLFLLYETTFTLSIPNSRCVRLNLGAKPRVNCQ